jgi:hypothetical protein
MQKNVHIKKKNHQNFDVFCYYVTNNFFCLVIFFFMYEHYNAYIGTLDERYFLGNSILADMLLLHGDRAYQNFSTQHQNTILLTETPYLSVIQNGYQAQNRLNSSRF